MDDERESSLISWALLGGIYAFGLSTWRIVELANLPSDLQIHPDFPPWLLTFLWAICISLWVIGGSTIVVSILALKNGNRSREWFLLPAIGIAAWILVYGIFALQDKAVGEGGLVWGVIHVVTLTRIFSNATELGISGYRAGQVIGLLVWCIYPCILFAASGISADDSPGVSVSGDSETEDDNRPK